MNNELDYWKFFAGLGLFLYGMNTLELALKDIVGRKFKLFLKNYTSNRFLAVLNGTIATAFLQSSSVVLLMVIAFAGAGIITLSNSLGIILGANLGTTMTGWIVSMVGFKTNFEAFILPMIAVGSLGALFINRKFHFYHYFQLLIAAGLLLMGLDFMKASMGEISKAFDLEKIASYGMSAFFLAGFIITAIIQSSSAMMAITLSALSANIVTLEAAAFIVIGADLGTTMTGLLASFKGTSVKKRVGIAHLLFNITTTGLALVVVRIMLSFLEEKLSISSPMYLLVAFHSSFNFLGIILFLPLLGPFEKLLNRFFINQSRACNFINKVSTEIPEASLAAIRMELDAFLKKVLSFISTAIKIDINEAETKHEKNFLEAILSIKDSKSEYFQIKEIEGELLRYFSSLQMEKLEEQESHELNRYILVLRNGVEAAKSAKDILHNIEEFHQSITKSVETYTEFVHQSYAPIFAMMSLELITKESYEASIDELLSQNELAFRTIEKRIYNMKANIDLDVQVASLLNVNREIYSANKLFIRAIRDFKFINSAL